MMRTARPLFKTVPFFVAGCWLGLAYAGREPLNPKHASLLIQGVLLIIGSLLVLSYFFSRPGKPFFSYRLRWVPGVVIRFMILMIGFFRAWLSDDASHRTHFSTLDSRYLIVQLEDPPQQKGARLRMMVSVVGVRKGRSEFECECENQHQYCSDSLQDSGGLSGKTYYQSEWVATVGKAVLYVDPGDSLMNSLPGDRLLVNAAFKPVEANDFPGQFDFKSWLALKHIHHVIHVKRGHLIRADTASRYLHHRTAVAARRNWMEGFRHAGLSGSECGVVSALLLGADDDVDDDLMAAFSASGTLHVLSVSGMHVALVYGLVVALFSRTLRGARYRPWKTVVGLALILAYAFLTGWSPAVQRAALVIVLMETGRTFFTGADTWNLLAASVLILLCIRPELLLECSFQLSYLAVVGILFFAPWLYERGGRLTGPKDWIWKGSIVTLAAQWFTFPLGLYYFHQFPNYFLLSNLIILPWSTAVLFGALFLSALLPWPSLAILPGNLLQQLTFGLTYTVRLFRNLPHAQLDGCWITGLECSLLLGAVLAATFFFVRRSKPCLFLSVGLLQAVLLSFLVNYYVNSGRHEIHRWKERKGEAVFIVRDHRCLIVATPSLVQNKSWQERVLKPALASLHLPENKYKTNLCEGSYSADNQFSDIIYLNPFIVTPDTVIRVSKSLRQ